MNLYIPSIILILAFFSLIFRPSEVKQVAFVSIHQSLDIKTNKNLPPYIAHEATQMEKTNDKNEWIELDKKFTHTLATNIGSSNSVSTKKASQEDSQTEQFKLHQRPFLQKIILKEFIIQKQSDPIAIEQFRNENQDQEILQTPVSQAEYVPRRQETSAQFPEWKSGLTKAQKQRIEQAEERNRGRGSSESIENFTIADSSREFLESTGGALSKSNPLFDTKSLKNEIMVTGHVEVLKGLAITNDYHIEFRRKEEGIYQERGYIDLQKGTYAIQVHDTTGILVAQLVTKKGQVIGEGTSRISQITTADNNTYQGPKVRILPKAGTSGIVQNAYKAESIEPAPENAKVKLLNGVAELDVKKDGKVSYDNLTRGSSTLLRAEAPWFSETQQIIISGEDFESVLFPMSMITSFKSIISEQRMANYNDPKVPVIWGQVLQDGKTIAGVEIKLNGIDEADIIYFNEFHLPDPNLKATSTHGGFAILNPPTGFQSILATRFDRYYAHQNTVVDEGVVSLVKLEASLKTENASIKVYDAFTGQEQSAQLSLQGLDEKLAVDGYATVLMPIISRVSILEAFPQQEYLSAEYLYNDSDGYIHVPLISEKWMSWIMSQLRINQSPARSIIIGFVPEEEYEVGILNSEDVLEKNIIFFDHQGQILNSKVGSAGGGFIIFNAPVGPLEVATHLTKSQKTISQLIPAEPGKTAILNFRSE